MQQDHEYEAGRIGATTRLFGSKELAVSMYLYFLRYYPAEMQRLRDSGVFGRESVEASDGPWDNIGAHCLIVALICLVLARLLRLSAEQTDILVKTALVHDEDKKLNRLEIKAAKGTRAKNWITFKLERGKTGLSRVTSIDLRDFLTWSLLELILRLADSFAGQTEDKKETITDGITRIEQLIHRDRTGKHGHKGHSQQVGRRFYQGRPFYEVLKVVTEHCQIVIWKELRRYDPKLRSRKLGHEGMLAVIEAEVRVLLEYS